MSTQKQIPIADAAIVPVEGPTNSSRGLTESAGISVASAANPFGANNEQLPDRLQEALRRLVFQFSTESESTRRQEVRRIKQAHQFWRGLQYLWWSEQDQNWHLPFEQKMTDGSSIEDLPRYEFVTNIYQAFGLSLVSVLSQDVPRVRFFPSSAQAEEDVAAAKAATEVAGLVERNNRVGNLIVDEAFQLWTDGKVGAYVRFVVDGQRFGFHPETEIGAREVRIGGDVYVCPECSAETAAGGVDGNAAGGGVYASSGERQEQEQIPRFARDDSSSGGNSSASSATSQPDGDLNSRRRSRRYEKRRRASVRFLRGGVDGRGFCGGGDGHCAGGADAAAGAEWAGSDHDCWRAGAEDSSVGQRDARVSVLAMES